MTSRRIGTFIVTGLVLVAAACGRSQPSPPEAVTAARAPATEAERNELSFLVGMTPHHAQAIDMGIICADRAADPRLKAACAAIVDEQKAQVRQMMSWALDWYGTQLSEVQSARYSAEGASGSDGILADEAMHQLATLTGREFDIRFTQLMIEHHTGAIASARGLLEVSPRPEVRQLAASIVESQHAEVNQMTAWQAEWTNGG